MTHTPTPPVPLASVVAENLLRLRTSREWSQADLAKRLRAQGLLHWIPSTVALVETGKMRADHLLELAALSAAFEVHMNEFLAGLDTRPIATRGEVVSLVVIRNALTGEMTTLEPKEFDPATQWGDSQLARQLGITTRQFGALVYDVFGTFNYAVVRDRKAGLIPSHRHTDDERNTRVRRGHATRALLPALQQRLEVDGIDVIWERTRPAWDEYRRELYADELVRWKQNWIELFGATPTDEEIATGFGAYIPDERPNV